MSPDSAQELDELKRKLLTMAGHAETAVTRAVKAVVDRDETSANQVKADDRILDQFEIAIDDLAVTFMTRKRPPAELRFIAIAMKISHDLERVGDEATTIARRAGKLNQEPELVPCADIPRMATLAIHMLKEGLESFVHQNPGQARAVIPRDKEVDVMNKQLHRELAGFMTGRPDSITRCLHLMVISKCLERIADHATNIAEKVVYLCEGHDIRHNPELKRSSPDQKL